MKIATLLLATALVGLPIGAVHADQASHEAAARKMLEAAHVREMLAESIPPLIDLQIKQNPAIAPYRETMLAFFKKYFGWDTLEGDFVKIYVETFSEDELNEMVKFYSSPIGQKAAKALPQLMTKGAAIGQQHVQDHIGELRQMLIQESQRRNSNAPGGAMPPAGQQP